MNKLTIEIARRDIDHLKEHQANPKVGLSMREELYLQALEKALPVLEQQGGWKHVPIEPTMEMIWAAKEELSNTVGWDSFIRAYKAMIATVPPQTDTYRQIENDGWIEWRGGECPVPRDLKVEVRARNDQRAIWDKPHLWDWSHTDNGSDIIAYRVIEIDGREG